MTPEEKLDEARAKEAEERWRDMHPNDRKHTLVATIAARLAREGWTPPEPVDPDLLAWREWVCLRFPKCESDIKAGWWDRGLEGQAYLAGARMAREQERERAKVLVEYVEIDAVRLDGVGGRALNVLAKYRGEA